MAGGYRIVISATDAASGVLDQANKRVEALNKRVAEAHAPFKRLGENFATFTKVSGLDKIATGFGNVAEAGTSAFRSMARIVEPLAAITGVASIAGLYRLVTAWGEFSTALSQQAVRAGVSADALYNLQNAAKLTGVSAETLTSGVTAMNDNMRNAAFGGAPQFLATLRNLGLSYEELQKMSPEKRVLAFADALAKVKSPTDRALYASGIFGGEGLLPLLAKTGKGIEDLEKKAKSLTGGFSGPMAAAGDQFRESVTSMGLATEGLGNSLASVLGPAIAPAITDITGLVVQMRQWVDANQAWLRGEISAKVGEFVTWIKGVNWSEVGTDITALVTKAETFAKALLSWIPASNSVLAFVGVAWLTGMLGPLITLTAAVLTLVATIGVNLPRAYVAASAAAEAYALKAASVGGLGGIAMKGLGAAGSLGLAAAAWQTTSMLDEPTRPAENGLANLAHNMLFDPNPMHWTQSYRPEAARGSGGASAGTNSPTKAAFVQKWGAEAQRIAPILGTSAENILAHWGQETGWGAHEHDNNPGNLQALPGTPGAVVRGDTHKDGSAYQAPFFAFSNPHDFADSYAGWMSRHHAAVAGTSGNALAYGKALQGAGYFENPNGAQDIAAARQGLTIPTPSGDPAPLPSATVPAGAAGAAGATGNVDVNVRVAGAGQVTARSEGNVGLNVRRPGLVDPFDVSAVPAW